ncbi:MAG: hypothetical protein AABX54_01125 [Nanoarchaeota archaeon]
MPYQTIEQRAALCQQIAKLKSWDKIEITTYNRSFSPLSTIDTTTQLRYFVKADGERVTVSSVYDSANARYFIKRRIKIGKISRIVPLQERVSSS